MEEEEEEEEEERRKFSLGFGGCVETLNTTPTSLHFWLLKVRTVRLRYTHFVTAEKEEEEEEAATTFDDV